MLFQYGFFGFFRLLRDLIFTKLFFSHRARLVRCPFYIRGGATLDIGEAFTAGVGLRVDIFPNYSQRPKISIGDRVQVNDYVHIAAIESIEIGNDVLIASKVFITDHEHGKYRGENQVNPMVAPALRVNSHQPVRIGDNVWIGELVSILPGVIIGNGAIIGANSVVRSNIPEYTIAAGVPAKVLKKYNFELNEWIRVSQQ